MTVMICFRAHFNIVRETRRHMLFSLIRLIESKGFAETVKKKCFHLFHRLRPRNGTQRSCSTAGAPKAEGLQGRQLRLVFVRHADGQEDVLMCWFHSGFWIQLLALHCGPEEWGDMAGLIVKLTGAEQLACVCLTDAISRVKNKSYLHYQPGKGIIAVF